MLSHCVWMWWCKERSFLLPLLEQSKELEIIDAIKLRDELTFDFYVPYHHGWVHMLICTYAYNTFELKYMVLF